MGRMVLTMGTFDLFHAGHVELLHDCKLIAGETGRVIVGLNSDEFVRSYKGRPPIMTYDERKHVLLVCRYVNFVTKQSASDVISTLELTKPDIIVVGTDWLPVERYTAQIGPRATDYVKRHNVGIQFSERKPGGVSASGIKRRIIERARLEQGL